MYNNPPVGYHYETLDEILENYDPESYIIVPISASPLAYGSGSSSDESDEDKKRRKRGFFSFMTSENEQTSATATSSSVRAADGGDVQAGNGVVDGGGGLGGVESGVGGNGAGGEGVQSTGGVSVNVDGSGTNATDSESWNTSALMNIVGIGQDVENSLVAAAPYLPMVCKVAMFVVPGLSHYQMLMMALNMATITSQAYRNYENGESITTVTAKLAYQAYTLVHMKYN